MAKRRWWQRAVIAAVLILIGWVLYVSSKQIERNRRIQAEISTLQTEAAKIRRENETLSERISYFATDDFREQEAKKKLGLKKTEEIVVGVKPTRLDQGLLAPEYEQRGGVSRENPQAFSGSDRDGNVANYKKWWNIFFGLMK
ncbi:MAG: septum formation initiator family protein [bacterium]|nr:septum formation initiator family protein [bacterium]